MGILDGDFVAPDVPVFFGIEKEKPKRGKGNTVIPVNYNGIKILSWGMIWPESSPVLIDDRQLDPEDLDLAISLIQKGKIEEVIKYLTILKEDVPGALHHMKLLLNTDSIEWGELDYLLIDTPPSTAAFVREVASSGLWGGIIVTIPSKLSLADTKRTIGLLRKRRVPLLGLICNMFKKDLFDLGKEEVEEFAKTRGVPILSYIPHSRDLLPYFTDLARTIISTTPIILEEEVREVEKFIKKLRSLADFMEGFK